jgi:hypothetical protein
VIICNYNGLPFLNTCLSSLYQQSFSNFEVILVDNGSSDNSVAWIRKNFPAVKIISNQKNLGFAKAVNQGIRVARGEYLVTLNNDTEVEIYWLENLIKPAVTSVRVGMCASKILYQHQPELVYSKGIGLGKNGCGYNLDGWSFNRGGEKPFEIFGPSACAALYKREMLDEIGLFDEDFFAYGEDLDLAFRAQLRGWRCVYVPEATVYHRHAATSKKLGWSQVKLLSERNKWAGLIKNLPGRIFWQIFPFIVCHHLLSFFYFLFKYKNWVVLKALGLTLLSLKNLLQKRREIQRKKTVKNYYLKKFFLPDLRKYIFQEGKRSFVHLKAGR